MTNPTVNTGYRVVIVDDEPLAREGLRAAIARLAVQTQFGKLEVVAVCDNAISGLEAIQRLRPEIALLDVVMPEIDAFAMLEQLEPEDTPPAISFVTAFNDWAVKAFEVQALDYLLKPAPDNRLRDALLRAVSRIDGSRAAARELARSDDDNRTVEGLYLQQLIIPEREKKLVLPVRHIEWIEGDTYYVRIHAEGRSRLLRERMQTLERALDPREFTRTHRSAIVQLDLVREIRQESAFGYCALLASGARVPVSKSRRRSLELSLESRR